MKRLMLAAVAVVLLMGMTVASEAVMKRGKGDMGRGRCGEQMMMEKLSSLGLDAKQTEAVKAIKMKTKKEMIRKKADAEVARVELRELLAKDVVDLAAVEAKVKQMEALRTEKQMMHIRAREEVRALLTPEQKAKFAGMHEMGCMECGMAGCVGGDMDCGGHGMGMKKKCGDCDMKGMDRDGKHGHGHHGGHGN